jgi:hypothetical protein
VFGVARFYGGCAAGGGRDVNAFASTTYASAVWTFANCQWGSESGAAPGDWISAALAGWLGALIIAAWGVVVLRRLFGRV